jgi:CRISPR-associated protein Cas1
MDNDPGLELARQFVVGKLSNQVALVKYLGKSRDDPTVLGKLSQARAAVQESLQKARQLKKRREAAGFRSSLMGAEGAAARSYWEAIAAVLADRVELPGRRHRGASDPVNAALNYGYGILYGKAWSATLLAGLEPYAGFLHVDRPGKPSFILDLVEEFRPAAVDRPVVSFFTRGSSLALDADGKIESKSRRALADHVLRAIAARHPYHGKRHSLNGIIHQQARAVSAYLRGQSKGYRPFRMRW